MSFAQEAFIILAAQLRRTVASARTVVLLGVYGMFAAVSAIVIGKIVQAMTQAARDQGVEALHTGALALFFRGDTDFSATLEKLPLAVLVDFRLGLYFLPLYVALLGFDQLSAWVGPRSIRFLTVRARRGAIVVGLFCAQLIVLVGVLAIIQIFNLAYAKHLYPDYPIGEAAGAFARLIVALTVFSLSYLSLSCLCSAIAHSSAVALGLNVILLLLLWCFGFFDGSDAPWGFLPYLGPAHYAMDLLHPMPARFLASVGAYLGFTAVFLGLATLVLERRDI